MTYRLLKKRVLELARANDLPARWRESSSHAHVTVGGRSATIPRHTEVSDLTAHAALRYLSEGSA